MYSSNTGYYFARILFAIRHFFSYRLYMTDKYAVQRQFRKAQGYKMNMDNPKTLNEKMQWLKIHDRTPLHTLFADKYAVRSFFEERFGKEGLIDIVYQTTSWKDVKIENMPDFPFILKPNHGSGWYHIIKDKNTVDWNKIRTDCRFWLSQNPYQMQKEWQYKNIPPCIIVEKLLIPKNGGIANNYRVHCMSGHVEIISVNLYLGDTRNFIARKFNKKWEPLNFRFGSEDINDISTKYHEEIPMPVNFDRMMFIAEDIAKDFAYVRVDFYEVDEKMYYGEITFHDSGGYDKIRPFGWDEKFGKMIQLTQNVC
jgi:hypothetical protein